MNKQKIYFPNLNGLRFIAASLVIIHHIEQIKSLFGLDHYWDAPAIRIMGKLGVVLFFVLSGFLITYLLLAEEAAFQTISIRKFYIRRILRIWPLYFLIITISLGLMPLLPAFTLPGFGQDVVYSNLVAKIILYALFLPNVVLAVWGVVPYASHTWSIGVEEQFYLLWPILLKYLRKHRIVAMVIIIMGYMMLARFLSSGAAASIPYHNTISSFWSIFNIDCMAIGGIYAILLFNKHRILPFLFHPYLFYSVLIIVIALIGAGIRIPYVHYECYAVLFGLLILNFAANPNLTLTLEHRAFHYLGNISYGLYMYHPIGITIALLIASSLSLASNWLIYPLSFGVTIGLAAISYRYFESQFLQFKSKFSNILSGK